MTKETPQWVKGIVSNIRSRIIAGESFYYLQHGEDRGVKHRLQEISTGSRFASSEDREINKMEAQRLLHVVGRVREWLFTHGYNSLSDAPYEPISDLDLREPGNLYWWASDTTTVEADKKPVVDNTVIAESPYRLHYSTIIDNTQYIISIQEPENPKEEVKVGLALYFLNDDQIQNEYSNASNTLDLLNLRDFKLIMYTLVSFLKEQHKITRRLV